MNSFKRASIFDPRLVIGPIQVCGLLSAALFGCLACQSYLYFARFRNDHLALKATLGHLVCVISMLWTMTVSTYGDPSQLTVLPLAADLLVPLSGMTVFVVQSFYVFRLWKLTGNVFLPILCQILSVIAQISAFLLTGRAISMTDLTDFGNNQLPLIELSFVARAVSWGLKMKRESSIRDTVTMVDRLILWTIGKILRSALMALTLAAWFCGSGFWLLWPDVVGNSLLVSLNRRLLLRDRASRSDTQSSTFALSAVVFNEGATQPEADPSDNFKNRDLPV
ncbi:hypothetical protein EDD22DRAFT_889303 [Suillus occidentalis]|nr:hypothetical protein EDD22DRAFT_889303 [Suillus occidentalis]